MPLLYPRGCHMIYCHMIKIHEVLACLPMHSSLSPELQFATTRQRMMLGWLSIAKLCNF